MDRKTKVDFHFHSNLSDGYFPPEALAGKLAAEGVYYAALTDHDTTDGQARFRKAAAQMGIVTITGVELFAWHQGIETHILGYGFEPGNPELEATFGKPKDAAKAIKVIHAAGGKAFLAHPFHFLADEADLEQFVAELVEQGLDGIEVYYSSHTEEQKKRLLALAEKHSLLVSCGSDFHGNSVDTEEQLGCYIPREEWKKLRSALTELGSNGSENDPEPERTKKPAFNWGGFYLRFVLPAVSAIVLFIGFIFLIILPTIADSLLMRKREMIQELTNSAWSILAEYQMAVENDEMELEEAQSEAIERIRYLRYGAEGKDYFWITDMHPRMIMHPYREDLNGTDLSNFADPDGVRLFVEFVNAVRRDNHGYVEYVWQWKDDPDRLAAKESYVRGFEPWGWVIGTGLYMEDVNEEISSITSSVIGFSLFNITAVGLLLWFVTLQSLRSDRKRSEFERELRISREKYRALAEAVTEGSLVISKNRCIYANRLLLTMLGYSEEELPFLDLADLLPTDGNSEKMIQDALERVRREEEEEAQVETHFVRKDGSRITVLVTARKASFAGEQALILSVADIARHKEVELELGRSRFKYRMLTENISLGVFRFAMDEEGTLLELNASGREILTGDKSTMPEGGLRDFFVDQNGFDQLVKLLHREKTVRDSIQQIRTSSGKTTTVSLSLVLVQEGQDVARYCDGIMEDISERRRMESDRERLLAQMQTSLLFLNEPVANFMHDVLRAPLDTPIHSAAKLMSGNSFSAIAVEDGNDHVVGLITDQDLRERVVARDLDASRPMFEIMTSPTVSITDNALVYEAFLLMRERRIRHLLVKNADGQTVGILRSNDLFRFDQYSPVILTHEIHDAEGVEDLVRCRERLSPVVSAMVSSGVNSANICRTVTAVTDSIVEKTISFALEKLGPPPVPFAFIAMGSEGREEQTLVTDQDNGIIYSNPGPADSEAVSGYFLKMGMMISTHLTQIGYAECPGGIMASSPGMNKDLASWKKSFERWIVVPDAKELLQFNILFDFRCVHGEQAFARELRDYIDSVLVNQPAFFLHLARNTLLYKPPLGLMGQIVTESSADSKNSVNIKDAMMPIVNFARLYALKHGIDEANTLDRLNRLREAGELREDNHKELRQAYNYMMQLRFKHQVAMAGKGREPDNLIPLESLSQLERGTLKRAFGEIGLIQKKVSFDYLGQA